MFLLFLCNEYIVPKVKIFLDKSTKFTFEFELLIISVPIIFDNFFVLDTVSLNGSLGSPLYLKYVL